MYIVSMEATYMATKYYTVQMNPETKTTVCPVCSQVNNHIADVGNCNHLHKLTVKGLAYYFWGFRPEGFKA